ncbi:24884_t:CDS:2, partial [Cetraspora pellucida]
GNCFYRWVGGVTVSTGNCLYEWLGRVTFSMNRLGGGEVTVSMGGLDRVTVSTDW